MRAGIVPIVPMLIQYERSSKCLKHKRCELRSKVAASHDLLLDQFESCRKSYLVLKLLEMILAAKTHPPCRLSVGVATEYNSTLQRGETRSMGVSSVQDWATNLPDCLGYLYE